MSQFTNSTAVQPFSRWLRGELRLDSARRSTIARITVGTPLMVIIAMTFQLPLPAYSAYLVFMVCKEDAVSTLRAAVGGFASITLAVGVSILFYVFDAAEPALRIPLLAFSTFLGMFLARTTSLGPMAFLGGYILVLTQTLLDQFPATEPLVHDILWLAVVVGAPIVIAVVLTLSMGASPVTLLRQKATNVIDNLASYLEDPSRHEACWIREQLIALQGLKRNAFSWSKTHKNFALEDDTVLVLFLEILELARVLPATTPGVIRQDAAAAIRHVGKILLARSQSEEASAYRLKPITHDWEEPAYWALHHALAELLDHLAHGSANTSYSAPVGNAPAKRFLVEGTFQHRRHARFAVKVMLAVLASYATYSLLAWPGIRTAVTTCFFVALTTVGESVHKFILRASGALIGGLLGGLCLVFVMPMMTDIGQLCVLVAAVSLFAAWIATGDAAISYAGMQIAFAFFLGVLQGYGPATDLTVLRDRVVGILVGNAWMTLIFTLVWPVSVTSEIRDIRASLLRLLGSLIDAGGVASTAEKMSIGQSLNRMTLLRAREGYEWRSVDGAGRQLSALPTSEDMAGHTLALIRAREAFAVAQNRADRTIAQQLRVLAAGESLVSSEAIDDPSAPALLRRARRNLEEDVRHAQRSL